MFSEKELIAEVAERVESGLEEGRPVQAASLANAVISRHERIEGRDKDFYLTCAWSHVRVVVRQVLRRYKGEPEVEPDRQIVMPGFKRLQRGYLLERDKESVLVRIDQLTHAELDEKAEEYERMGEGCRLHALELRRYKIRRAACWGRRRFGAQTS